MRDSVFLVGAVQAEMVTFSIMAKTHKNRERVPRVHSWTRDAGTDNIYEVRPFDIETSQQWMLPQQSHPFLLDKSFHTTPSYQASQASSFCWGTSYLMSYHTASRSISWLHGRGVTGEDITEIILCSQNKTKYFRLRLTDEISSERPKKGGYEPTGHPLTTMLWL